MQEPQLALMVINGLYSSDVNSLILMSSAVSYTLPVTYAVTLAALVYLTCNVEACAPLTRDQLVMPLQTAICERFDGLGMHAQRCAVACARSLVIG